MGNPAILEKLSEERSVVLQDGDKKTGFVVQLSVVGRNTRTAAGPLAAVPSNNYTHVPDIEPRTFRDAVCGLTEKTVSLALTVPLAQLQARTRMAQEVALARQIAMYLCHTTFSLPLTEVGLHFKRDRTTVSHACNLVEDKRDKMSFDVMICQLEALLNNALEAAEVSPYCSQTTQCSCEEDRFAAPEFGERR